MGSPATKPSLESTLQRIWTRRGAGAWLLLPLSLLYVALSTFRRLLYRTGILPIHRIRVPVIVVGNVIAGGAGKTPTTIAIVQHLQSQGHRVGVISRGYGRKSQNIQEVFADAAPELAGDEPLLIQRKTSVPVFVAHTRYQAAQALLARYPDTELIICDDGLQHFSLYRDLEICVFDDRGCGNGWLLPSGPLRETWPRRPLKQAGQRNDRLLVLHTGGQPRFSGFRAQRSLAAHAVRSNGETVTLDTLQKPGALPLMAVAAIAQPAAFFRMLELCGLVIAKTLPLPDHYDFDSFIRNEYGGYQLICTEKDTAKLWQKAPDALAIPLTQTMEPAFWRELDRQIAGLSPTKLSSPHGHKIT